MPAGVQNKLDAALLAQRYAAAGGGEEWLALFSVALDEVRDVKTACDMADACLAELANNGAGNG